MSTSEPLPNARFVTCFRELTVEFSTIQVTLNARHPYRCLFRGFRKDFWVESWHATAYHAALAYDAAIRRVLESSSKFPRHGRGGYGWNYASGKGSYKAYVARLSFPTIRERRIRGEDVGPPPPPPGPPGTSTSIHARAATPPARLSCQTPKKEGEQIKNLSPALSSLDAQISPKQAYLLCRFVSFLSRDSLFWHVVGSPS